jgi:PPM family protein phosphatase
MEGQGPSAWQSFHNREVSGSGWIAYGESQTGWNHALNEDNCILLPLQNNRLLVAVADGLGGHNAGQVASRLACETLYDCAQQGMLDRPDDGAYHIAQSLESIVLEAHQIIGQRSQAIAAYEGMGCTLTAVIISATRAWFCHVGDSRLYHIGNNICQQLTDDQNVNASLSSAAQLALSVGGEQDGHLLEQALGLEEEGNPLKIQQGSIALHDGDCLLVCSDGLHDRLAEQHLAEIVRSDTSIVKRVHDLIEAALQAESSDDITAVLVNLAANSMTAYKED